MVKMMFSPVLTMKSHVFLFISMAPHVPQNGHIFFTQEGLPVGQDGDGERAAGTHVSTARHEGELPADTLWMAVGCV